MSEKEKLAKEWNEFCLGHQKACLGKGTVGKPGMVWEKRRAELWHKVVQAGIYTKDGYTVL